MPDYSHGYEGSGYGRRYEEEDERYGRGGRWRGREERGFLERAGDELRSWFGDEEAERRRVRDEGEYSREGYRPSPRGDYERGYGEYGRGYTGYGREGYRGDYERGYGRERYAGEYGQGGYGRSGYGREGYYGGAQEYGRGGRYGTGRYGGEYGYGERGYTGGSEYGRGYGEYSYTAPYWSYTEMWMIPGPYTGRGPSGYRRSDERIMEDINERLLQHGQIDATDVNVSVSNGEATLTGQVGSRMEKRLAEDVAESCPGVREVHNNLRVKGREQEQPEQYGEQMTGAQPQYGTQPEQRSRFTTG
jgi:osmotically-inducible protein OsmY